MPGDACTLLQKALTRTGSQPAWYSRFDSVSSTSNAHAVTMKAAPSGVLSTVVVICVVSFVWLGATLTPGRQRLRGSAADGAAAQWQSIGPMPISVIGALKDPRNFNTGRITALAVDPVDSKRWFAGAATGGIWETTDSGLTWTNKSDALPSMAIGALAFAPSDPRVMYAGTGEGNFSRDAYAGVGILKSVDGGGTWALVNNTTVANVGIGEIRVYPNDPGVLLAITIRANTGRFSDAVPVSLTPSLGVLKSTDGGVTWIRTLIGEATDLEIDPGNFNRQYAAIGVPCRPSCQPVANSVDNGVYRSTDGGNSWKRIDGPWTSMAPAVGRVELAMAPSNSNIVYASIEAPLITGTSQTQGLLGLFRTDDAWSDAPTWIQVPTSTTGPLGYCDRQCSSAHMITIDPSDPAVVFAAGVELWRCSSCGTTPQWTKVVPSPHPYFDNRAAAWAGTRLLVGTDQGVISSLDRGASWQNHTLTMSVAQVYSGALYPTNSTMILASAKDNGCMVWSEATTWGVPNLNQHGVCEGEVAISATHPDTDWMAAADFGQINRTRDGGKSFTAVTNGIDEPSTALTAAVRKCPGNDDVFLTGNTRLWRTNDFFSAPDPTWRANGPANSGSVRGIAFADADRGCNTYAFGTATGRIWLTTNGGGSWSDLTANAQLPARIVNSLAFDPQSPSTLYAAFGNFDAATPGRGGHVFKTTNAFSGAPSWTNVSPPEDRSENVIAIHPSTPSIVYVGSDVGVWRTSDAGATWQHMGPEAGMPSVPVHDLKIRAETGQVFAFTFGRGVFVLTP